jgi:hypothetical protein
MRINSIIIFGFISVLVLSCKKDKTTTCPPQNHYYLTQFSKQFNFKKNSYWVLKNTATNLKDTLSTYYSPGPVNSTASGTSKECYYGDIYESYIMFFSHKMFAGGSYEIDFSGGSNGFYSGYYSKYSVSPIAILTHNGDSTLYNNNSYKSKLENIYSNLIVSGVSYTNVYQMVYSPDLYGFNRIWWCPNIGFIKFEYYNTTSSQTEFWELDSYNVQLY